MRRDDPPDPSATPPTGRGCRAAAVAAAFLLATAAACGDAPGSGASPAGDPLVLGYKSDLQTLNPVLSTDQNANELIYWALYTPLVTYDSAYEVRPWLAESWSLSDTAVTFTLREDVRWHDGEPVTAEDVVFTFRLAKDPEVASPLAAAHLSNVASAEALGPRRVRFAFARPHASPLQDFFWPPVPEHLLGDVAPERLRTHPFGRDPVGSGPYRLERWEAGEGLTLRGVGGFPEELGGAPAIGRVEYRIMPEATTRLRELLRGGIHVDGPLSPDDADRVRRSDAARLVSYPWRQFVYLGWNTRHPLFGEPAVRRALTLALDREELLEAALYGHGEIASGVIPPWHPLSPDLEPLPHDPDSAVSVLASAGWRDRDGDGVRERDGEEFGFVLLTTQETDYLADLGQMIQAQLAEVGVRVELRLLEWQTVLSRHRSRDFEAVLTDWVLDSFRVDPRPLFHSDEVSVEGSANRSSYANPVADSLMELGVRLADRERAREVWRAFSEVVQRDQPFTFLFWKEELAGVSRRLEGVGMDARGELTSLPAWRWAGADASSGGRR